MCVNITGVVDFTRGRKYCEADRKYCEVSLVGAGEGGLCGYLRLFFAAGGCFVVSFVVTLLLSLLSLWGYKGIYIAG